MHKLCSSSNKLLKTLYRFFQVLFTLSCIVVVTSGDKANHGNVVVGKPSPRLQLKQQQPAAHEAPALQSRFPRFRLTSPRATVPKSQTVSQRYTPSKMVQLFETTAIQTVGEIDVLRFARFRSNKPVQRKSYKPQNRNTVAGRGLFAANKPVKKSRAVASVNPFSKLFPATQSRNGNGNFKFAP